MDWISKAPTTPVVENMIHVLLVDHHANAIDMFAYFFLKVTSVRFASTALSILSQGKPKFDLVMENIHSPDGCGFMLLQDTVQKGLPVILLLEEDDVALTKRGLEAGALLCIKKPLTMEIAEYLWQLLLWEKRKRRNNNNMMNVNAADHHHHHHHQDIHVSLRSKVWIEWTKELHDKFMDAVRELGEGKCYPKDILELMNVPGLTRMQVASHLQKCRGGSWKAPNNRKPKLGGGKRSLMSARRSYGCMPPLPTKSVILHADDDATASSVVVDQNDDDEYFEFPNFDTMIPPGLEEEDEDIVYYSNQLNNATVKKETDMMIDWLL